MFFYTIIHNSSHWQRSVKKVFLKILQISQENICVGVLFLIMLEVACLRACNFFKKRLQHSYFPVTFVKFLRTPILKDICEWLLLISFQHVYATFPSARSVQILKLYEKVHFHTHVCVEFIISTSFSRLNYTKSIKGIVILRKGRKKHLCRNLF